MAKKRASIPDKEAEILKFKMPRKLTARQELLKELGPDASAEIQLCAMLKIFPIDKFLESNAKAVVSVLFKFCGVAGVTPMSAITEYITMIKQHEDELAYKTYKKIRSGKSDANRSH
jgi:hypothetical protein